MAITLSQSKTSLGIIAKIEGSVPFVDANGDLIEDNPNLFWDDANDRLGIGTPIPDGRLHVHTATAGAVTAVSGADELIVENSADAGISILGPDNAFQSLAFGSPTDAVGAKVRWTHDEGTLEIGSERLGGEVAFFSGNFAEAARFDSGGNLGIGTGGPTSKLHVEGTDEVAASILVKSTNVNSDSYFITRNDAIAWSIGVAGDNSDAFTISRAVGLSQPKLIIDGSGNIAVSGTVDGVDIAAHEHSAGSGETRLTAKDRRQFAAGEKHVADSVAGDTLSEHIVLQAQDALTVTKIFFLPDAALIANDIDYARITVYRRDSSGGTQSTVATVTTTTGDSGNWVAFDAVDFGAIAMPPQDKVAAGEVLTWEITKVASGVIVPSGTLQIEYTID